MTGHVLDLSRHHFRRELGDIVLYGTWIGESLDESEPCLVLVPNRRFMGHDRTKPCCVALSAAYRYDNPSYMLSRARQFNADMGFSDSMSHVHKVASIIYDHLQDLIEMPPRPVVRAASPGRGPRSPLQAPRRAAR